MQILFERVGGFLFLSFFSPYLEKSLTENPTDMIHGRGKKKKPAENCFLSLYHCPYSMLPHPLPSCAILTS